MIALSIAGIAVIALASGLETSARPRPAFLQPIAHAQAGTAPRETKSRSITPGSMGPIRLNMTLGDVRRMLPDASFERGSDGDGAALVEVTFGQGDSVVLWAGEDDPGAPVDWSRRIITIYTFSDRFSTLEGVRPGALVADVVGLLGPIREVSVSEIESRQFIRFERQPSWLTLRLDYTGIFPAGARTTTRVQPGARILGIYISAHSP